MPARAGSHQRNNPTALLGICSSITPLENVGVGGLLLANTAGALADPSGEQDREISSESWPPRRDFVRLGAGASQIRTRGPTHGRSWQKLGEAAACVSPPMLLTLILHDHARELIPIRLRPFLLEELFAPPEVGPRVRIRLAPAVSLRTLVPEEGNPLGAHARCHRQSQNRRHHIITSISSRWYHQGPYPRTVATFRRKKHAVERVAPGSGCTRLSDKRVGWGGAGGRA